MELIDNQLKKLLSDTVSELGIEISGAEIILERPNDRSHGDWATNLALVLAKRVGKNPRELAGELVEEIEKQLKTVENTLIASIEMAGPGFINFKLKDDYYLNFLEGFNPEKPIEGTGKLRLMVECGDPNTHKMPHIGHLYSYIVGDSIGRIMQIIGHEVCFVNYQGDIGPQVAKCIYGWREKGKPEPESEYEKIQLLQECYQLGSKAYKEDETAKDEIDKINKAVYTEGTEARADWEITRKWSLDYCREFEARLGIDQKYHYLESNLWEKGMEIVRKNIGGIFKESDGAIVFPGEDYGLHTRVFITKYDTPTYECKELGLSTQKMEDWPFDLTIIPTGNEQSGYFKVVIKAVGEVIPELKGKIEHIGFGMVNLSTGKMSSRTGQIISAPELIDMAVARVAEVVADREGLSEKEKSVVAEKVAIAAVKYAFLKGNVLQNMTFDLEESISFEGNSGPYLLYTYARIQSLLGDIQSGENAEATQAATDYHKLSESAELEIIKKLEQFRETIEGAASSRSPHLISTYIYELAQAFNSYYREVQINKAEPATRNARRKLSQSVGETINTGLQALGIDTIEKM